MPVTLTVTASTDYRLGLPAPFSGFTDIVFSTAAGASAEFDASQFDGVAISTAVALASDGHADLVFVHMAAAGTFSAAGWNLASWASGYVAIDGSASADSITGSAGLNHIAGGGGADTLIGGGLADTFVYHAGTDVVAGESVAGAGGDDLILVESSDAFDFTGATLSNVEFLVFAFGYAPTVTVGGNQIGGAGLINAVEAQGSLAHALIVTGAVVDLSAVTFNFWTAGRDFITINGTALGADVLIGSSQADMIIGGPGADYMRGDAGDDTYLVDNAGDTVDESALASTGNDTIVSSLSFALANNVHAKGAIENLQLSGVANINGSGNGLANSILGNSRNNSLGGGGADTIKARGGNDVLNGGAGNDGLLGGNGQDRLDGRTGNDTLSGGGANDRFRFTSAQRRDQRRSRHRLRPPPRQAHPEACHLPRRRHRRPPAGAFHRGTHAGGRAGPHRLRPPPRQAVLRPRRQRRACQGAVRHPRQPRRTEQRRFRRDRLMRAAGPIRSPR